MILSFAWTTGPFLAGLKTVTRRKAAARTVKIWQKKWDERNTVNSAYDKTPLYGGEYLCDFELVERPHLQPLWAMPEEDLIAEGGMWQDKTHFIECLGGDAMKPVLVIRFEIVDCPWTLVKSLDALWQFRGKPYKIYGARWENKGLIRNGHVGDRELYRLEPDELFLVNTT